MDFSDICEQEQHYFLNFFQVTCLRKPVDAN